MTRKPLIAGNWKMNNTIAQAVVLAQEVSNLFERDWADAVDVAVCPPYVDLKPAYTGEISIPMLKDIGCRYCIVGHSERRTLFHETNEDVNDKVRALFADKVQPVHPIVCVGESLAVRDEGTYLEFVDAQVRAAFAGTDEVDAKDAVVAYEPVWAIGTGRTATPEQAQEVCAAIRATLAELFGAECADGMRVLYGGSMNEGNADLLLAQPDIDGGLIGGASLKAGSFVEIVKAAL